MRLALVVEGYGEVEAAPVLVRRVSGEIKPNLHIEIHRPIRVPRNSVVKDGELERYVELAARQVGAGGAVFVLLDADDDNAADLGPQILERATAQRSDVHIGVCLAVSEFEAWFLAAAESIAGKRGLSEELRPPDDPEGIRGAKGWLQRNRTDGRAYSETTDQPALAAQIDMSLTRSRCCSFDKFWRELERLIQLAEDEEESTS